MLSDREAVELVHLLFVRALAVGKERTAFRIKGGCNLRFFFHSIRYSEHIDLDVVGVEQFALKDRIEGILSGRVLLEALASRGLSISDVRAPKQTQTTQRWKLGVMLEGRSVPLRTKIEFSRRHADGEHAFESVQPSLIRRYKLPQFLASHYLLETAIRQKTGALIGRRETQARDIFDLSHLFDRTGGNLTALHDLAQHADSAIELIESVSYGEFAAQVIAFLVPEQAAPYASEEAWLAMQLGVLECFQRLGEL